MYYLYILYSKSTNHYYIGSSENPEVRLTRHNAGVTISTKSGRPWQIVYTETFQSRSAAIQREKYVKRMKSRKYIESLIFAISNNTPVL